METGNHEEVVTDGDHTIDVETGNQSILVGNRGSSLTEVTSGHIDMKAKSGDDQPWTVHRDQVEGGRLQPHHHHQARSKLKIGGAKLTDEQLPRGDGEGIEYEGEGGNLGIDLQGGLTASSRGGCRHCEEGVAFTSKGGVAAGNPGRHREDQLNGAR